MKCERLWDLEYAKRPIPTFLPDISGWKELPITGNEELLVPLGTFSTYKNAWKIPTTSIYAGQSKDSPYFGKAILGSEMVQFAREQVVDEIMKVQAALPFGYHLIVYDAWRSLETQSSLYNFFYKELQQQNPSWDEEKLTKEAQRFVSLPSIDPKKPSPHNTGGSIDLAILKLPEREEEAILKIDEELERCDPENWRLIFLRQVERWGIMRRFGQVLEFGTEFDYAGPEAGVEYFETIKAQSLSAKGESALLNRRVLYHLMEEVGNHKAYKDEWWHYNSVRSQMGAKSAGLLSAEYGAIELSEENILWAQTFRGFLDGFCRINKLNIGVNLRGISEYFEYVIRGVSLSGDPAETSLKKAAIITP